MRYTNVYILYFKLENAHFHFTPHFLQAELLSLSLRTNLKSWNVHTDVTTFAQVLVLVLVVKSWSLSLRVKSLSLALKSTPGPW